MFRRISCYNNFLDGSKFASMLFFKFCEVYVDYKLKNRMPSSSLRRESFRYEEAFGRAVMRFSECPKALTIVTHADTSDPTPLHCFSDNGAGLVDLLVPRQSAISLCTEEGFEFLVIKVSIESAPNGFSFKKEDLYWLFTYLSERRGFLLLENDFIFEGE